MVSDILMRDYHDNQERKEMVAGLNPCQCSGMPTLWELQLYSSDEAACSSFANLGFVSLRYVQRSQQRSLSGLAMHCLLPQKTHAYAAFQLRLLLSFSLKFKQLSRARGTKTWASDQSELLFRCISPHCIGSHHPALISLHDPVRVGAGITSSQPCRAPEDM